MSGIYINGISMPTEGFVEILIRDDGTVLQTGQSYRIEGADYYTPYIGEMPVMYKAIPVPDHGDLIDSDAMKKSVKQQTDFLKLFGGEFEEIANVLEEGVMKEIDNVPTIIPADKEAADNG